MNRLDKELTICRTKKKKYAVKQKYDNRYKVKRYFYFKLKPQHGQPEIANYYNSFYRQISITDFQHDYFA